MPITVVITTWQVPYDQTVKGVHTFAKAEQALDFINSESHKWWRDNDGDLSAKVFGHDAYEPITKLGYQQACYELWGGESGFHAMIDEESWYLLYNAYCEREFDDKGIERPGYLQVADAHRSGDPEKLAEVERKQQEVFDFFNRKH